MAFWSLEWPHTTTKKFQPAHVALQTIAHLSVFVPHSYVKQLLGERAVTLPGTYIC